MKITEQSENLRAHIAQYAKEFKLSWVHLGQGLYSVWRDKLYQAWEFDKFEDYVVRELGLKKPLALKLVKTYFFVEQEEPVYLKKEFAEVRDTAVIPGYEGLDVLRLARGRKELTREDYTKLRKDIFEKGKEASLVKKDLTTLIKERKKVDPQQEREARHDQSVRRLMSALKSFKKDMETLRLGDPMLVEEAEELLGRLENTQGAPPLMDLDRISEQELLATRIKDLPITIEGTWLKECVQQLYAELDAKGLVFHPECYLADEWLTPEGEVAIGIPFYLAHPALIKLERRMMLEAEGEGKLWCMQLLRHEAGHAFSYAYDLNQRQDWQEVFGSSRQEYGDTYKFKPYSKSYVRHLDGFYAQYHPDEDFVETFAVWLTPGEDWRQEYQGWKALDKLQFVDRLMAGIKGVKPLKPKGKKFWQQKSLTMTLGHYYQKKHRDEREEFPDFHDVQLRKIFTALADEEWEAFKKDRRKNRDKITAQELIREHYKNILNSIDRCTGERKYIISDLLKNISVRAGQLHMMVTGSKEAALMQLSVYVTSLIMNYVHTGWLRGTRKRK